jgi:hypothetical protein
MTDVFPTRALNGQLGPDMAHSGPASTGDAAIRRSTITVVCGVAAVAATVSYRHLYDLARDHGETGLTALALPLTVDGLIVAASLVMLHAARHSLQVPVLARILLGLGIAATIAANVAHGLGNGLIGAMVAAWPALSLIGSYELLMWLVRTSASQSPPSSTIRLDEAVIAAKDAGKSIRAIARDLQISRRKVGTILARVDQNGPEPGPPRSTDFARHPQK